MIEVVPTSFVTRNGKQIKEGELLTFTKNGESANFCIVYDEIDDVYLMEKEDTLIPINDEKAFKRDILNFTTHY